MLIYTGLQMSGSFTNVTGITSCTTEVVDHVINEALRHWILSREIPTYLESFKYEFDINIRVTAFKHETPNLHSGDR